MERMTQPSPGDIADITVREAWRQLQAQGGSSASAAILIDVRERDEYMGGRAPQAINIPLSELRGREGEVPHDRDVLLICHLGQRSLFAARHLRQQGLSRVFNVDGGMDAWEHAGLPIER